MNYIILPRSEGRKVAVSQTGNCYLTPQRRVPPTTNKSNAGKKMLFSMLFDKRDTHRNLKLSNFSNIIRLNAKNTISILTTNRMTDLQRQNNTENFLVPLSGKPMPTHWESSERPLFVKTVVVNGNRHAILSQVDPLCQARKPEGSSHGYTSPSSITYLEMKDDIPLRRVKSCYPLKRDISSDLQNCLVKLRVALSTQEQKKKKEAKDEDRSESESQSEHWKPLKKLHKRITCTDRSEIKELEMEDITGFKKGNSYCSMLHTKENDDCCYQEVITKISDNCRETCTSPEIEFRNIPEITNGNNQVRKLSTLNRTTEEVLKNYSSYFFPIVYIKANHTSWNNSSKDNYSARNFNNPLSERVLQWLELAQKRKDIRNQEKPQSNNEETNSENLKKFMDKMQNRKYKSPNCKYENMIKRMIPRPRPDDDEYVDEVKQESDIETVLSSTIVHDYPKYSKELNRHHIIKTHDIKGEHQQDPKSFNEEYWINSFMSIPEKISSSFSITERLQESILKSFDNLANQERTIQTGRIIDKKSIRGRSTKAGRKKGLLMKQTKIRISSDDEETKDLNRESETRCEKKKWENKKRQKCRNVNDENEEPSDESSRDMRILYNEIPLSEKNTLRERGGRRLWVGEKGFNKPQLHIFMPEIDPKYLDPQEDSSSDSESYSS